MSPILNTLLLFVAISTRSAFSFVVIPPPDGRIHSTRSSNSSSSSRSRSLFRAIKEIKMTTNFRGVSPLFSGKEDNSKAEDPVECFLIVEEEDDIEVDADDLSKEHTSSHPDETKQRVVCTSEPEEYAWFNGIDEKNMVPADGIETEATECVEDSSPRGIPEWECK